MAHQACSGSTSLTIGDLMSLPVKEWPEPWQALQRRVDEQFEPYKDVRRRMSAWQRKAWRHLTLPEIKRRLDAQPARWGERAPRVAVARRREHRSRAHARRGPPSD